MKNLIFVILFCATLIIPLEKSFAKDQTIKVTLPNFTVNLNGNKVNNLYRKFPFLVYKNIVYLPMTWYDSRFLGLETEYLNDNSFNIEQKKITSSFEEYASKVKNNNIQYAKILDLKVMLNGKFINNSNEKYPLLIFRDVIYFPITWNFCCDEFNWKIDWNDSKGLSINSNNNNLISINLPKYAGENSIAIYEEYYYFVETVNNTNNIYRISELNNEKKELVYSYEIDSSYGFQNKLNFEIINENLWFSYHSGGASMGSDVYCKINKDGKVIKKLNGYLSFKETTKGDIIIDQYLGQSKNNLSIIPIDKMHEKKKIGDTNLIYGLNIKCDEKIKGYTPDKSTHIIGEDIYILASKHSLEKTELNRIYKVNINTNETLKVVDFEVENFKIINNKIYYVKNTDKHLYSCNLDGTGEKKISSNSLPEYECWYGELNGNIYYKTSNEENNQSIYKAEINKEDTLLLKENLEKIEIVNGKLIVKLAKGEDYGVKILDENGNIVLTVANEIFDFFAYKDNIILIFEKDKSVKLIKI